MNLDIRKNTKKYQKYDRIPMVYETNRTDLISLKEVIEFIFKTMTKLIVLISRALKGKLSLERAECILI
nr:hypothetical protein [Mycoplasmopsis bovis]